MNLSAATPRRRRAFTLTELLVVIGILAVLTALLLPALCRTQAHAHSGVCKANLRQFGVALEIYAGDFHCYPTRQEWVILADGSFDRRVMAVIRRDRSLFWCPAKPWNFAEPFTRMSYGYNSLGSGRWDRPGLGLGTRSSDRIGAGQVRMPGAMIAIGDSGAETLPEPLLNPNADLFVDDAWDAPEAPWLPSARHRNRANTVFCDGHVESARQLRWIERSAAARRRWNNDHEPHPEAW